MPKNKRRDDAASRADPSTRSVRRKVEKLRDCTRQMTQEIDAIRKRASDERKAAREKADEQKAAFLQKAAALRRQTDDAQAETLRHREEIVAKEPELHALRARMAAHRPKERQRELERESQGRLASVQEECARLRALLSDG